MKQLCSFAAIAALVALAAPAAQATDNSGYLTDKSGNIIKTKEGLCLRTKEWSADKADPQCLAKSKTASTR